jgi:hypothetical protein
VARFSVANEVARSTVNANEALFNFWNPHSTIAVRVVQIQFILSSANTGGRALTLNRSTTTGATFGATYTPDVDSQFKNRFAPVSGVLLYQTPTTQPTLQTPPLFNIYIGAVAGSLAGFDIRTPIMVPAGTGLAIQAVSISSGGSASFTWEE